MPEGSSIPALQSSASRSIIPDPQRAARLAAANDRDLGAAGRRIDPDALDGPTRRAHPATYAAPFEGRAGRGGAGHQPLTVADDHLAIGADIEEQANLLAVGDEGGLKQPRGDIAADIAADARREQHVGIGVHGQADLVPAQQGRTVDRRRVGLQADIFRIEPKQEVDHGRVADDDGVVDLGRVDGVVAAKVSDQAVEVGQDQVAKLLAPLGEFGVIDPADDVQAARDLAIVFGGRAQDMVARQVGQVDGAGGRSDVDGQAEGAGGGIPRLDADDFSNLVIIQISIFAKTASRVGHQGGGHQMVSGAQGGGEPAQDAQAAGKFAGAAGGLDGAGNALQVAEGIFERRGIDLQAKLGGHGFGERGMETGVVELGSGGMIGNDTCLGRGLLLDQDGGVTRHATAAGQRPAFAQFLGGEAAARGVLDGAGQDADTALAAGPLAAAGSRDRHASQSRGIKERDAGDSLDGFSGGLEGNLGHKAQSRNVDGNIVDGWRAYVKERKR